MKILFLNFALIFVSIQLFAQEFAPVGAEWHYDEQFAFSGNINYMKFTSEKDTLINGQICKKITKRHKIGCNERPEIEYLYTSNDTVFFLDTIFNEFQILYVFSANQGESWNIKIEDENLDIDTIIVNVDSTSITNINGFNLKTLYVTYHKQAEYTYESDYSSTIIEKIGDVKYMFNWNPWENIACDDNWTQGLRCYYDSLIGSYSTNIADSCEYTYIWTEIKDTKNTNDIFKIYPNPTSNFINIETDNNTNYSIEILDITGKLVYSTKTASNKKIKLNNFNSGIYLLRIKDNDNIISSKKIIIN